MGKILTPVTAQPYTEQFSVEYYSFTTSSLIVDVRNTGNATVNLSTADYFLGGIKLTAPTFPPSSCVSPATSTAVVPTGACSLTWSSLTSYSSGIAYVLKIVLTDGSTFTFSLIAGNIGD
jgi:archaellum component FlaF (FlaF/FlaG flagellin family)